RRRGGEPRRALHQEGRDRGISRARHGGDLENRGGKFPRLHRDRRQGQRLLQGIEFGLAVIPGRANGASPQLNLLPACARVGGRQLNKVTRMASIKVTDMAYGRLKAPDLDVMEEFLTRFGMVRSERTNTALYMRGTDSPHHIHVTEKGEPKFIGFAYYAASEDDLARVARAPGALASRRSTSPVAASGCGSPSPTAIRSRSSTASPRWRRSRPSARSSIPAKIRCCVRAN